MARGAVEILRERGIRAGLFRLQTLWPFPTRLLRTVLRRHQRLVVVEASSGQLEDELRLALSHEGVPHGRGSVEHVRRQGGVLPPAAEIVEHVLLGLWASAHAGARA